MVRAGWAGARAFEGWADGTGPMTGPQIRQAGRAVLVVQGGRPTLIWTGF